VVKKDFLMRRNQANNFMSHRITKRDLHEECYGEGCSIEEVRESLENHERTVSIHSSVFLVEQSRAEQSRAEQSRAEQSRAEQSRAE